MNDPEPTPKQSLIDISKKALTYPGDAPFTAENVQLGCLQRIAASLELFTSDHQNLIQKSEYWKARAEKLYSDIEQLKRSNAALKGQITKLKKQQHEKI